VQARLKVAGKLVDEAPPVRFGFREFTRRGADFYLNGKPTHLRGHQIDLAWADQKARVEELKAAGMNCFEFSGPIGHDWYGGTPYRQQLFDDLLNYADEHGLIALPVLPGAKVLKERIFEPEVAKLYRHRLAQHFRQYGDHPSIGMWFMHFNLAGYHWDNCPTKIDGSYKPADPAFLAKERYAVEAQRLAQTLDPRPLYHHACGNFGDIFTLNCYLGPTPPLQEREEWPARWAEKRPFPLLACEHCLMLIPYWFRPRQFPLSVVYAGEPLFDQLSAKYLGRRAYQALTPELFDLYDVGRTPRETRLKSLVAAHPGYQEVKSLFARYSLRSWRTYGVSGIIFNAVNWDFHDEQGKPLPMQNALARYFGDTDLYIAGPGDDWPSKDHSFYSGETIRKQVVLLNDLTRDLPCTLKWRLQDEAGKRLSSGTVAAVSHAGKPTMYPVEFAAPDVPARSAFKLVVEATRQSGDHFSPEAFDLEVFPRPAPVKVNGQVLVFDPVGDTTKLLQRAGATAQPLQSNADLGAVSLLVVGRKAWGQQFLALAKQANLEQALQDGLNLLVLEQVAGAPFGLKLTEQSARQVFPAVSGHPFLKGLDPADFHNLRGQSDLLDSYPEAPPETEKQWPKRYFKGNYSPCGYGGWGRGRRGAPGLSRLVRASRASGPPLAAV